MSCANCQIQLCIYESTHGTFDESTWPVKDRYNDYCQSINQYYKEQNPNQMDDIQQRFLQRAR